MVDVLKRIYYSDVGSGDFVEVDLDSLQNLALLIGNESITGDSRVVVFDCDIDALIEALSALKREFFE